MTKVLKLLVVISLLAPLASKAGEPFVGEIKAVGFNFCPPGWTEANGQLLPINSYQALFSLYGTIYGGDGETTFGLPDLRGRAPIHAGTGPGLQSYPQGSKGGAETHTLTTLELPSHSFNYSVVIAKGRPTTDSSTNTATGANNFISEAGIFRPSLDQGTTLIPGTTNSIGAGLAHNIRAPYLTIRYCVALLGIYPSQN